MQKVNKPYAKGVSGRASLTSEITVIGTNGVKIAADFLRQVFPAIIAIGTAKYPAKTNKYAP